MSLSSLKRIFAFLIFCGICNINLFGTNLNFGISNIGATKIQCDSNSNLPSNLLKLLIKNYRSKYMSQGISELHLPPLEPLKINRINFQTKNQRVEQFDLEMTNLTVTNVSTFKINSACVFFKSQRIIVNFSLPVISGNGQYKLFGVIKDLEPGKTFNLDGSGSMEFQLNNVQIYSDLVILVGEKAYLNNFDIDFSVESVNSNLENLQVGRHIIEDVFPETLRKLKPKILPSIRRFLGRQINDVLSRLTYEKLFEIMV